MEKKVKELEEELINLKRRFNILYNAKEQMKQNNYKLRGENRSLKKRNYELTLLIDTFLKIKKGRKNMERLTESQQQIYSSIKKYIAENKISPSVRELCYINGLSSPATMKYYLNILKKKGYITFRERTSRSIVVLD